MWCCSGLKKDHANADGQVEPYIRCQRSGYTEDKINILLKSLQNIGTLRLIKNEYGNFLDIRFPDFRCATNQKGPRITIQVWQQFYSRFKELTDAK